MTPTNPENTPAKIEYTLATSEDANVLAQLSRDLIERGLRWRYRPPRMRALIRDRETVVLTARAKGKVVGFATMTFGYRIAHLILLAVRADFQRQGIARRMMQWLFDSARIAGIERVVLEVRATDQSARSFYRQLGFTEHLYLERYYDQTESAFRMTLKLADQLLATNANDDAKAPDQ